ncbi:hypothetical protein N0V90_011732 [Kalmusia sp. IMI 367209]|nr:hypothetical protein N0V90_011732 [Kalmusia sp. IMI 367209]
MGLLCCFTLNFKSRLASVLEPKSPYEDQRRRPRRDNLVTWRTWPSPNVIPTVRFQGDVIVIFTEHIRNAGSLVYGHFNDVIYEEDQLQNHCADDRSVNLDHTQTRTYIVTSISHIQIFKKNSQTIESTPVEPFVAEDDSPLNPRAVRWMLNAIHGHTYPISTHMHNLPVELQEMILKYASDGGEIDQAYYSSVLGLGLPFDWKSNKLPLRRLKLARDRIVNEQYPEQQLMFWFGYVGVTYQPDDEGNSVTSL